MSSTLFFAGIYHKNSFSGVVLSAIGIIFWVVLLLCDFIKFSAEACQRCCSKSEQTDEDKAAPYPINIVSHPTFPQTVPKSLSSRQLEQKTIRNFTRNGQVNEEVILKLYLDQDAFAYYSKARNCEKEEDNCVICLEALTTRWRLVPCGHASFCSDCSQKIFKEVGSISRCPLCRTEIKQVNSETARSVNGHSCGLVQIPNWNSSVNPPNYLCPRLPPKTFVKFRENEICCSCCKILQIFIKNYTQ